MYKLNKEEKSTVVLFAGCWLIYMMTMFSKCNYTAAVAYIVKEGIFTKANAGLIASCFYIFYGAGQFLGGFLADKWSPYKIVTIGIGGAFLATGSLAFTTDYTTILIIWSLNGVLQCGVWPGINKIINEKLMPDFRKKAAIYLTYGYPIGSLFSYLCAALLLEKYGWGFMFGISAFFLFSATVIWVYIKRGHEHLPNQIKEVTKEDKKTVSSKGFLSLLIASGLIFTLIPSLIRAILNNGLQVWIPTMIMENYSVSSGFASFQSVLLLALQIIGLVIITPFIKKVKRPMVMQPIILLTTFIPVGILQFTGAIPIIIVVAMLALVTLIMNAVGMLYAQISIQFGKTGYSGLLSGFSNAMASFGVVLASGGFGVIAERFGWSAVTFSWIIMIVVIIMFQITAVIIWEKFYRKLKNQEVGNDN